MKYQNANVFVSTHAFLAFGDSIKMPQMLIIGRTELSPHTPQANTRRFRHIQR